MHLFMPYLAAKASDLLDVIELIKYFAFVISEGDWLNDWLTHLPPTIADAAQVIGYWLANINL